VCLLSYEDLRMELSRPRTALTRFGFWRIALGAHWGRMGRALGSHRGWMGVHWGFCALK